ncbi:LuxR C-terminal-related transcriptional regulator [Tamlana sp. I1]|uniref:helix-turn-helix and ligand-binding sensor domain-containing protein n=1 Tax=Tamlana sp. I1 TaxID=2762061 RepID=UPI00188F8CBD|nr:LuxR C-terminal-related transcriptional regulator [Tamlana sp. I1]
MKNSKTQKTYKILKYIFFCACLVFTGTIKSQTLYPEITNYSFGSSQNWSVDVNFEASIAVANNAGLSTYNGQTWEMHQLPKNMIIRSVLCDGDIIYTGSYEEFGYWKKDALGELKYNSLKSKFEVNNPQDSEEYWQIIKYNDLIIFRSFGAIYAYDGTKIKNITTDFNVSNISVYKNKLIFGSLDRGVLEVTNSGVKPYFQYEALRSLSSVSHLTSFKDLLFVFDQNSGGYLVKADSVSKLPEAINLVLKNFTLNKVTFIDETQVAFGTVKNGVVIYNFIKDEYRVINKRSGLRNNTVLDMALSDNNLWLALDDGVSRIAIKSEYAYFNDITGTLGAVYDVAFFNNAYYLASNTGVYTFIDNELALVANSEGHCWSLFQYQNKLLCAHNRGAFVLESNRLVPIEGSFSGVYNYYSIPRSKDLLISTYSGIAVLKENKKQFAISALAGLEGPIDKVVFQNDSTLWATGNYEGLFKVDFDSGNLKINDVQSLSDHAVISENKVKLEPINNQLYFVINGNWFTYSNNTQSFGVFVDFKNKSLLGEKNGSLWMYDNQTLGLVNYDREFKIKDVLFNKNLTSKFVTGYEKIIYKNDSTLIFNLKDGFSTLNLKKDIQYKTSQPKVAKIYVNRELFQISKNNSIELNHEQAQLVTFDVYTPGHYENALQYQLKGRVNQEEAIVNGVFTIQNLPAGDYNLTIFEKKQPSRKTHFEIKILPPWYLSTLMVVFYLMLVLLGMYLAGRYQKHKAEKAHLKTQKRLKAEAEKKLQLVEKNNLINEIKTRKKELTNRTASIVKKNETIILLRNELKRLEKVSPNVTRTKNILHRSGEQLDSKNDWHIFESKFNELNEDFFKNLSKAFPKLTTKDRKLCAYIKVGLTSKEIAPLLGITVRSVELQRYRLRKKLNLDAEITFIEFLRGF